ncbi:ciliary neurotrophic factor [Lampris incognitus]|uniref:ciliary neurotrophic factor n=1 Tax=Lampris incognitus TaxID=2546036 RepID=UPI0024B4C7D5|nr:ciliary neurotrophic factor [Lampris incognitus]
MADRRTRGMTGSGQNRTTAARAAAIAEQLHYECTILLELFRKRESLFSDFAVGDGRLVSVPSPSSQLDTKDKLWCLHSALLQCRGLLERAMSREEEELGGGEKGEYESQGKLVRERLSLLLGCTGELLKAADGSVVLTPNLDSLEIDRSTSLFELKLWIYRVFKEVDYWSQTAITMLQALPAVTAKEVGRTAAGSRRRRSLRR